MHRRLGHEVQIQAGIVLRALQGGDQRLGGRLGSAVAQRGEGCIDDIHARLDGLKQGHIARARSIVRVQVDGDLHVLLEALDQAVGLVGQQQVGHVLDADGVRAQLLNLLGELDEIVLGMHGADGVAHSHFADAAVLLGGLDGRFQVAHVVEGVENADDIDAVLNRQAHELLHHVVGIVLVAEDVLAAEEHLQLGVGQGLAQLAQALPRVFVQKAQAAVKRGAAPALQGIIADLVENLAGGQHVFGAHTGCGLRLVRVTENRIGNQNLRHGLFLLYKMDTPGGAGRISQTRQ